jgi:hypothetical protein
MRESCDRAPSWHRPCNTQLQSATPAQVLGVMEAAAEVLPAQDVRFDVCRRLAGLEPFVDFGASDPHARGLLLGACFGVLATLARRGIDVRALLTLTFMYLPVFAYLQHCC